MKGKQFIHAQTVAKKMDDIRDQIKAVHDRMKGNPFGFFDPIPDIVEEVSRLGGGVRGDMNKHQETIDVMRFVAMNFRWRFVLRLGPCYHSFSGHTLLFGIMKFVSIPDRGALISRDNFRGFRFIIDRIFPFKFTWKSVSFGTCRPGDVIYAWPFFKFYLVFSLPVRVRLHRPLARILIGRGKEL